VEFVDLPPRRSAIEWPTAALAALIYGLWLAVTYWHRELPPWLLYPVAAWTVAWQMSLQHEVIHGHPTSRRWLNILIGTWPLVLWYSFESFRRSHLQHHNDERLTDPLDDPESYYWAPGQWEQLGGLGQRIVRAQTSLIGRVTIGPAWAMSRFWWNEVHLIAAGDRRRLRILVRHLLEMTAVLIWVIGVCGVPFWSYFFGFAYAGTSLALVRSFAEHRAEKMAARRTAIVENSWIFGPLFLFNNLHAAHHMRASLPWYRLPAWYRLNRAALIERNGGLVYETYFDVARRYLLRPHDAPLHPSPRVAVADRPR
jgi:fatty acid desaturase